MTLEELEAENKRLLAEIEKKDAEFRTLNSELEVLRARLQEHEAEMEEERKAIMFMLNDTNEATDKMEDALDNLREETEITKHLLMIAEATAHTTDVDKLMGQIVYCCHEITGCDIVLSYLWDRAEEAFKPSQERGLPHDLLPLFRTESINEDDVEYMLLKARDEAFMSEAAKFLDAKEVISSAGPVLITAETWMSASETGIYSQISAFQWMKCIDLSAVELIPLVSKTDYLGMIVGIYKNPPIPPLEGGDKRGFELTEEDKKLMQGISHQVSAALEQARLYKESMDKTMELSHKIATIQIMHEIDRSILSTLESHEIMETVARLVSKIISCDKAAISFVDKERHGFIYGAEFGITGVSKGTFLAFEDTTAAEVVKTARPEYIANLSEIRNLPPFEEGLVKEGFLSHIRIPLIVKGEIAGILTVGSKRASAYTPEDLSVLEKIAVQIGVALENSRLVTDLQELFLGTIKALSSAIDAKSKWTAGHSERVTKYAVGIGKEMGLSEKELKDLELAGLLHDIGKIGTYESILDKPDKLTDEELSLMRQHPAKGAEMVASIKQLKDIIPGIKHHHEFYDGRGYPDGLKGEGIPLMARILAVADTYDAMKADRPYRTGRTTEFIIAEFRRCSGTQFDPKGVEAFLKAVK